MISPALFFVNGDRNEIGIHVRIMGLTGVVLRKTHPRSPSWTKLPIWTDDEITSGLLLEAEVCMRSGGSGAKELPILIENLMTMP